MRQATTLAFKSMRDAEEGNEGMKEAMSALTELKVFLGFPLCLYAVTVAREGSDDRYAGSLLCFTTLGRMHACLTIRRHQPLHKQQGACRCCELLLPIHASLHHMERTMAGKGRQKTKLCLSSDEIILPPLDPQGGH